MGDDLAIIIAEAEREDFGTIVVGRRGTGKSFFAGSVSMYVVENTANITVWFVP